MKDETCGVPIKSFVGLKGKMYTFIMEDKNECKKAKEINNYIFHGIGAKLVSN